MANYTVTKFKTAESIGDSIFFNNMVTSGTVTITPNSKYVVSASDFSISSLPTGIESVVFTDNATAGQPGNTVTATFTFASDFSVTSNFNIGLDIQGDAKIYNPTTQTINYTVELIDQQSDNLNGASALTSTTGSTVSTSGSDSDAIKTYTISGSVTNNKLTKIASLTITNDPGGFYFKSKTYLKYIDASPLELKLKQTSATRDSSNRITSTTYDVLLKISSDIKSIIRAMINYDAIAIPTETKRITRIDCGYEEISSLGENKTIRVYGDIGAEFNITVIKNSDKSSIINKLQADNTSTDGPEDTVDILDLTAQGAVKAYNKKINKRRGSTSYISGKFDINSSRTKGISYCDFKQSFPAGTDTYFINVYPLNGTTLADSISSYPSKTVYQYANPTLVINAVEGTGTGYTITTADRKEITGRPNVSYENSYISDTNISRSFTLNIVATRSHTNTFKTVTNPAWSSSDSTVSHWDNSVAANNGGTSIEIYNAKTVYGDAGAGANTIATITADVYIKKWGNADVTMTLDTGKFLTCN